MMCYFTLRSMPLGSIQNVCVSGKYVMTMPGKLMYDTLSGRIRLIWLSPERGPLLEKEKEKPLKRNTSSHKHNLHKSNVCFRGETILVALQWLFILNIVNR